MAAISCKLFFHCCLFLKFIYEANAQSAECDDSIGNYTANSTYNTNLNTLLTTLSSHTEINYGFYNFSYGQNTDKVNAIGLCRGDVEPDECRSCLNDARGNLTQRCPNQKKAIIYYDNCMLRYSNTTIFGVMETSPALFLGNTVNATDVEQFNQVLQTLMSNLTDRAASGDSRRKYATGSKPAPDFQTTYGYTQCTPDLSSEDCTTCLGEAISDIPNYFNGKAGGNVLKPSCRIRFDPYSYYGPTLKLDPDASPTMTNNTSSSQGKGNTSRIIIAIVVPVASVVLVLILFCIYLRARKSRKQNENNNK